MVQARIAGKWMDWMRRGLAALLCLCLAFWSPQRAASHIPDMVITIQDHAEMIDTHGHSHGFEEDLAWALHGHSHDAADHDHSPALLVRGSFAAVRDVPEAAAPPAGPSWRPGPVYPRERPPRM
ncbi:hypothetical protein KUV26_15400 [Leisingera daeponensis]|uniref:Uncharacterized protein n=1 Tax=Leisingera daeponensis TaxID=405746 RepID=A0ABS7NI41_9RHOB|nr:hypothetical protein [Leisingera daeponensis]MBY6140825.1 hypothetical protein [Leisingera daeponensis]